MSEVKCADLGDFGVRIPKILFGETFRKPILAFREPAPCFNRYAAYMAVLKRDCPSEYQRKLRRAASGGGQ